jgi:hypothetical protein
MLGFRRVRESNLATVSCKRNDRPTCSIAPSSRTLGSLFSGLLILFEITLAGALIPRWPTHNEDRLASPRLSHYFL